MSNGEKRCESDDLLVAAKECRSRVNFQPCIPGVHFLRPLDASLPKMASLETLPAPLPLHITKHLADLITLHAVCLSCPLVATVFTNHAAEIFEHLMNKCLSEEVIVELRAYILLRTQDRATQDTQYWAIQDLEGLYSAAQEPLVRTTPAPAIRHTLHIFTTLSTTSNSIFDTKLRRLYALPHQHFADKSSNNFPIYQDNIHLQPGRLFKPPLLPSQPDWDEQQRLLRAIWRLKIWTVLEDSDSSSAGSVPTTDSIPSAEFAGVARVGGGVNEDSMDELTELPSSLEEIGTCNNRIAWEPLATKPILQPEALARKVRGSHGYAFFNRACQGLPYSPLLGANWAVMRRLGFGIWSTRRLRIMGYKSTDRQHKQLGHREPIFQEGEELSKRDVMFTWNCLYRTAAGESIRTSGADMSRYRDDAE